ncbi:DUF4240 domain-containing protein [Lutibacter maritimus]|uniref:DUF4240 domain-containing protein n=1 Tax=Lutibacter maritimus TaxID=593133 RepID=A0A1I6SXD8_9FLAO|nr:DUF4240 domain-containing protein [Lutibacter maritimus]SFS81468.1 Protein of unknown function [Lutibacter maritimus]
MEGIFIGLTFILLLKLYNYYRNKKTDEEFKLHQEYNRKYNLKVQLETREIRENFNEFDEDIFWDLIDKSSKKSRGSYKNQLGLLKDYFRKLEREELIELDNLVNRLYRDFINQDLLATSLIMFKTSEIRATYLLMSIFMTRGRVFFKNACLNPNLIIGKELKEIDDLIIPDLISDIYLGKTDMLIPLPDEIEDFKIKGEKWTEKELPSKYSELWMAFA